MPSETRIGDGERASALEPLSLPDAHADKLVACPFVVAVDGNGLDSFYDVRDAIAAARAIKRDHRDARVTVTDMRTGKLVIEVTG